MSSEPAPSLPEAPDQLGDQLSIDTPEQTTLQFPLAGIGSRFLALALDTLIQSAALLALFVLWVLTISGGLTSWSQGPTWMLALFVLAGFLLYYGYFVFFEVLWNGQTPGKRAAGLRVIKDSGAPITVYEAVIRNLLRIVDSLPTLYGLGIVTALCNRQNKRLGDYAAGTVVVHEKPLAEVQPLWPSPAQPAAPVFPQARLTPEEFQLVDAFLRRRSFLEEPVRSQMAAQIANRLAARLRLQPEGRLYAETFLETLAQQQRDSARYR